MKTKTIIFLIVAFILVGGITLISNQYSSSSNQNSYNNTPQTPVTNPLKNPDIGNIKPTPKPVVSTTPSYTLTQVATHNNASSCWTIINTGVYDVTSWIGQHPGGAEAILSLCGHDGTAAFEGQHGGQQRPANELAGFLIGSYKK